ncbi:MAG: hypothetical protein OEZ05_11015 [Nitrospirota bacterium]|nr:hypothetical protein [Nitrospirota bacterium]MDH5587149.1 hypothetical protein [Nitrospirota bacterium]
MEINQLPPSNVAPIRAPSAVGDGDAGPNSPSYRGRKHKQRDSKKESREAQTPHLEGSTSHIDIRV